MIKFVPLTQGQFAIVDAEDFDRMSQHKWHAHKYGDKYYAGTNIRIGPGAEAYDAAAKKHHGEFARLNFPEQE